MPTTEGRVTADHGALIMPTPEKRRGGAANVAIPMLTTPQGCGGRSDRPAPLATTTTWTRRRRLQRLYKLSPRTRSWRRRRTELSGGTTTWETGVISETAPPTTLPPSPLFVLYCSGWHYR